MEPIGPLLSADFIPLLSAIKTKCTSKSNTRNENGLPSEISTLAQIDTTPPIRLNLGCGRNIKPDWVNIDSMQLDGVNIVADLDTGERIHLPFSDNSVDEFLLSHVLEHIKYPLMLMEELYRIAKPTAIMTIHVPYGSSDNAFEDPTHVRQYFKGSWGYFSQPYYWRADYGYHGDWLVEIINLYVIKPGDQSYDEIMHMIDHQRNIVVEMVVTLKPVKPKREPLRELQVFTPIRILWV